MNTLTVSRIRNPQKIFEKIKEYVDAVIDYEPVWATDLDPSNIQSKTIHLAIPEYTSPTQWRYINRAIIYAKENGVKIVITRVREMKPTQRLPFTQWADVNRTEKFISVQPMSGYSMVQPENEGYVIYLGPDAADEALGQALLKALDKSRFIWPDDEPDFFKWQRYMQCHRNWQADFMRRYGYKTKREAYNNMDWCRAKRSEGTISIKPHKRDKPEYWRSLPPDRSLVIPDAKDAAAAGAALRLALDRCE